MQFLVVASVFVNLMYAMHCTRPNISYVRVLSQFTSTLEHMHWNTIKRVFGYLKKTMDYALHYSLESAILEWYTDASSITGSDHSKSTSGWTFMLAGAAVSWASKKQTCTTHSTMESKFVALAVAGKGAEWLRDLLTKIPLWPKPVSAVSLHCDSTSTLLQAYSGTYNGKSRHIALRHRYVRELLKNGVITLSIFDRKPIWLIPLQRALQGK